MSNEPGPKALPTLLIPRDIPAPEPLDWEPRLSRISEPRALERQMTTVDLARIVAALPETHRAEFIAELRKHAAELKPLGWSFDEELCRDLDYTKQELAATRRVLTEEASQFQREADRERRRAEKAEHEVRLLEDGFALGASLERGTLLCGAERGRVVCDLPRGHGGAWHGGGSRCWPRQDAGPEEPLLAHYAGPQPSEFWRRLAALPEPRRRDLYAAGVLLQETEAKVLAWLDSVSGGNDIASVSRYDIVYDEHQRQVMVPPPRQ